MTDQGPGIRPALPIAPGATNPTPTAPLPSRAAMPQTAPPVPLHEPVGTTSKSKRVRKPAAKKPQLSATEIKRLNAKRKQAVKDKADARGRARQYTRLAKAAKSQGASEPRRVGKHPALAAPYGSQAKNPNRPLELRNQMDAMLLVVDALRRPELVAFKVMMQHLAPLPKKARRKIIAALAQVYP